MKKKKDEKGLFGRWFGDNKKEEKKSPKVLGPPFG